MAGPHRSWSWMARVLEHRQRCRGWRQTDTALRQELRSDASGGPVVSLDALLYDRDPVPPGWTGADGLQDRQRRGVLQRH